MIDLITGWFKIPEYKDKHDIIIAKLVETTWLTRYSWQTEINHDQGSELVIYEFRNLLNEKGVILEIITLV